MLQRTMNQAARTAGAGTVPERTLGRAIRRPQSRVVAAEQMAKRWMDVSVALLAIIALAPLMVVIAIMIRRGDGGPALFRQIRVGKDGRRFACLKFRSMVRDAESALQRHLATRPEAAREWAENQKLANDPRVTGLGNFLRRSSLDELPQLFNVLAGDMSLVGPRPIVPAECSRYGEDLKFYLAARPGITGLWQVSGRSDCSYPERVALDVAYAKNWRLTTDLVIVFRTVPAVLLRRGSC